MSDLADLRSAAEDLFRSGFCGVAAAFNLTGCRSWKFDRDTKQRAQAHLEGLMELFHEGEISALPIARAKVDGDFQRFLQAAITKPARAARNAQGERTRGTGSDIGAPRRSPGNAL